MVAGSKNGTTARTGSAPTIDATKTGTGGSDKKPGPAAEENSPSGSARGVGPKQGSRCPECCRVNSGKWYRHKTRDGDYTCDSCYRFYKSNQQYRQKTSPEAAAPSSGGAGVGTTAGSGSAAKDLKQEAAAVAKLPETISQKPDMSTAGASSPSGQVDADEKGSASAAGAKRRLASEQDSGARQKRAKQEQEQGEQEQEQDVAKEPQAEGQCGKPQAEGQARKHRTEGQVNKPRKAIGKRMLQDGAAKKPSPPQNLRRSSQEPAGTGDENGATGADGGQGGESVAAVPLNLKAERAPADALADMYPRRRAAAVAAARGIAECSARATRAPKGGNNTAIGSNAAGSSGTAHVVVSGGSAATGGKKIVKVKAKGREELGAIVYAGEGTSGNNKVQGGSTALVSAAATSMAQRTALLKAVGELQCVLCGNKESRRWCKHRKKKEGLTCERCDDYFRRHGFYHAKKDTQVRQPAVAEPELHAAEVADGGAEVQEQSEETGSVPKLVQSAALAIREADAGEDSAMEAEAKEPPKVNEEEPEEEGVKPAGDATPAAATAAEHSEDVPEAWEQDSPKDETATAVEEGQEKKEEGMASTEVPEEITIEEEANRAIQEEGMERMKMFHREETKVPEEGKRVTDAAEQMNVGDKEEAEQEGAPSDRVASATSASTKDAKADGKALRMADGAITMIEKAPLEEAVAAGAVEVLGANDLNLKDYIAAPELRVLPAVKAPTTCGQPTAPNNEPMGATMANKEAMSTTLGAERELEVQVTEGKRRVVQKQFTTEPGTMKTGSTRSETQSQVAAQVESAGHLSAVLPSAAEGNGAGAERGAAMDQVEEPPGDADETVRDALRQEAAGRQDVDTEVEQTTAAAIGHVDKASTVTNSYPEDGPAAPKPGGGDGDLYANVAACVDGSGDAAHLGAAMVEAAVEQPMVKRTGLRRQQQLKQPRQPPQDKRQDGDKATDGGGSDRPKAAASSAAKPRTSGGGPGKSTAPETSTRPTVAAGGAVATAAPTAGSGAPAGGAGGSEARSCAACGSNRTQSGWRRHQGGEVGKVVCKRCYDWHYRHGTYERTSTSTRSGGAAAAATPTAAAGSSSVVAALRRPRKAPGITAAAAPETSAAGDGVSIAAAAAPAGAPILATGQASNATRAPKANPLARVASVTTEDDVFEPPNKRQKLLPKSVAADSRHTGAVTAPTATVAPDEITKCKISGPGPADKSIKEQPLRAHINGRDTATHSEVIEDHAVLQLHLESFCDVLARACKALVELENQYGIRLLDIPAPLPAPPATATADASATAICPSAVKDSPMPPARSALRLFYERVCGSDVKLRSRHLADVLIRWLELNAWRSPLAQLLGPAAGNLPLDGWSTIGNLHGDKQAPRNPHTVSAVATASSSMTPAALDLFRQVVESLALNMAQNLLGIRTPTLLQIQPAPAKGNNTAPVLTTAVTANATVDDGDNVTCTGTHAEFTLHLENVAAAALHLAQRVATAPGHLALRLVAPGDPILATVATVGFPQPVPSPGTYTPGHVSVDTSVPAGAVPGGSCLAVTAVEWVRCGAGASDMEAAVSAENAEGGGHSRHLRLAHLLRNVYAGSVAQWQDSNVALTLGQVPLGNAADLVQRPTRRYGAASSAPAVLWMVAPGIVRRELQTDSGSGEFAAVVQSTAIDCSPSPLPALPARPSGTEVLPPGSGAAILPSTQLGDSVEPQGPVEVAAATEAAGAVCVAVAKALARGDHDAVLDATVAAADVVLQLVRAISKDGFVTKPELAEASAGMDLPGPAAVSELFSGAQGQGVKVMAQGDKSSDAATQVQQPLAVVVEVPIIPAMVIGCEAG